MTEQSAVGDWQPGKTAPKDGTQMLAITGMGFEIASYCHNVQYDYVEVGDGLFRREERAYNFWSTNVPLLWMPLPTKPSDAVIEEAEAALRRRDRAEDE